MLEFLRQDLRAQLVVYFALCIVLIFAGWYVVAKVRSIIFDKGQTTSETLTKFTELHSQGEIDDEELRSIKWMLAERLKKETQKS